MTVTHLIKGGETQGDGDEKEKKITGAACFMKKDLYFTQVGCVETALPNCNVECHSYVTFRIKSFLHFYFNTLVS